MTIIERNVEVGMVRADLEGIPHHALPPGYSVRWYRPGDEELWVGLQSAADKLNPITPELFQRAFGSDAKVLAERQCFLCAPNGTAIGTATAWFDDMHNRPAYGRLHWVAIAPETQGRGLCKPLLTVVLNRMRELGHERAYLTTSTARIRAINLYLKFGFVPEVRNANDYAAWRGLREYLKEPFVLNEFTQT